MKKSSPAFPLFMGLLAFASCKGTSENKWTTATDTVQAEKPTIWAPFTLTVRNF